MTTVLDGDRRTRRKLAAQVKGPAGGGVVAMPMEQVVPAHLLDGGEIVLFALKPSLWFIPLVSLRWLATSLLLAMAANMAWNSSYYQWYLYQAAFWTASLRLCWAALQWVSRLYVLTNRRVLRLRGVFNVDLFECPLHRIQNTVLSMSLAERLARVGTIVIQTAGTPGGASWRFIPRPVEVHEKLCDAIHRAQNRGGNGV